MADKVLSVDNLGFVEIGGVGEMVYRAVRFPEYYPDTNNDADEVLVPIFTATHPPISGTDYTLTGQRLLVSLCNLYKEINAPDSTIPITDAVWEWCRTNIHPYDIDCLTDTLDSDPTAHILMWDILVRDATFRISDFVKDLCDLGTVFEYYFALDQLKKNENVEHARGLYYEGRIRDGLASLERYRWIEDDEEYRKAILGDYRKLIAGAIDMIPDFRMRLKVDKKTGKVMYGADVQSVFDIAWYTFSRWIADVAPPMDQDLDYEQSTGSILSCLACGQYFVRHSSRQLYCGSPDCEAERNRKNKRNHDARERAKKQQV